MPNFNFNYISVLSFSHTCPVICPLSEYMEMYYMETMEYNRTKTTIALQVFLLRSYHHRFDMSRPERKPTLWNLRKASTLISLRMPRRLTRTDNFRLLWSFCFRNHYSISLSPLSRNMSARVTLRGLRWLI